MTDYTNAWLNAEEKNVLALRCEAFKLRTVGSARRSGGEMTFKVQRWRRNNLNLKLTSAQLYNCTYLQVTSVKVVYDQEIDSLKTALQEPHYRYLSPFWILKFGWNILCHQGITLYNRYMSLFWIPKLDLMPSGNQPAVQPAESGLRRADGWEWGDEREHHEKVWRWEYWVRWWVRYGGKWCEGRNSSF